MLGHKPFYHEQIKKYAAGFGTLFNDIYIDKASDNDTKTKRIKIPLTYSSREKMITRVQQDPNIDRPDALNLPTMAYDMMGIGYDPSRKISSLHKLRPTPTSSVFISTPYNISYQLQIYSKTVEDGAQIIEQILPFFQPDFTVAMEIIDGLDPFDVPIVLNTIQQQDIYTGDMKEKRAVLWILEFTMKVKFYGPVATSKIIRFAKENVYLGDRVDNPELAFRSDIQPGLTANGQPTSNSAASIDPTLINPTDDWGYVVTITDATP